MHTNVRRVLALVALVLVLVVLAIIADSLRTEERFCPADGRLGPDGQVYGRDPDKDCKFVDENGRVLPGQS